MVAIDALPNTQWAATARPAKHRDETPTASEGTRFPRLHATSDLSLLMSELLF